MSSKINIQKIYRDKLKRKTQRLESLQKLGNWWWWIWIMMKLSNLPYSNRFFTHLAGLPLGIYRSKIPLKQFKPYISPKAQISCRNLQVGSGCFIDDFVTIYGGQAGGSVILDKEVRIYRGTIIEVEQGGNIIIGKYSSIQPNCNLLGYVGDVQIGSKVMIGPQCGFTPYQHTMNDLSQPMSDLGLISKGNIVIEDDVWLGMGVKVMDGVRIGQGSVIGANAVVTRDIPPYSIAVGVPARVVRKRTDQL